MTDRSTWTDEQVNEAVFKLHNDASYAETPDYTHDWRLAGELLEEMKPADVSLFYFLETNSWGVDWIDSNKDSTQNDALTPQRAICEAWLAWKEQG